MTERDKLIELLNYTPCNAECCSALDGGRCGDLDKLLRCQIEAIADYLLANDVIVPPVKVGQSIYRINRNRTEIYGPWDIVCMTIYVDETGFFDDSDNWVTFDEIGKTVFLTREEAEQALRKKDDGK